LSRGGRPRGSLPQGVHHQDLHRRRPGSPGRLAPGTINGAYTSFEEAIKGTLTPGKLADITVLSKDILTIPEEEIPTTEVVYTIVGGEVKYRGGTN